MSVREDNGVTKAGEERTSFLSSEYLAKARIFSGLVLFGYVLVHFSTHALGLISLDVLQSAGAGVKSFWRFPPVSVLLYGSIFTHLATSLWQVFNRRTLKMPAKDWLQIIVGIAIPPLVIAHVVGTGYASWRYGINDTYAYVLMSTFVVSPFHGILNTCGLIAAWIHGCIGMHNWLDQKRFYTKSVRDGAFLLATLLPAFSLTGYLAAAREVAVLAQDGEWLGAYFEGLNASSDAVWTWISGDTFATRAFFLTTLTTVIVGRLIRNALAKRSGFVTVDYSDGPTVRQPIGSTLLEISRRSGVDHANVCGGRGRCSTCRVFVIDSKQDLTPPSDLERKVLDRVRAPENVRLACQLVPQGDIKVLRMLPTDATFAQAVNTEPWSTGQERIVAVLFADLRDFTRTSENRLPFDVVYLINQFSQAMGKSVESYGGRIDKFLGDGLMALFGISTTPEEAATAALKAAARMQVQLDELNDKLAGDLDEPLRMGIGIHVGAVVLGSMGYGASRSLTAIGDTVNTASRLEAETKKQKCVVCISADTASYAGIEPDGSTQRNISVRGKRRSLDIYAFDRLTLTESAAETGAVGSGEAAQVNV